MMGVCMSATGLAMCGSCLVSWGLVVVVKGGRLFS